MSDPLHILMVEDNEIDVRAMRRSLRKQALAHELHVARDGVEALEVLRDAGRPFGERYVVLLDLNMPRMSGHEFLGELRRDPALTKAVVFVLTTSDAEEDVAGAYDHHVAGYMLKRDVAAMATVTGMLERYAEINTFLPEL
ncbi:MAG: response regulator [Candidatus Accumulibacter sp.]|nr:response regulator [Accumulibacter sp.]